MSDTTWGLCLDWPGGWRRPSMANQQAGRLLSSALRCFHPTVKWIMRLKQSFILFFSRHCQYSFTINVPFLKPDRQVCSPSVVTDLCGLHQSQQSESNLLMTPHGIPETFRCAFFCCCSASHHHPCPSPPPSPSLPLPHPSVSSVPPRSAGVYFMSASSSILDGPLLGRFVFLFHVFICCPVCCLH